MNITSEQIDALRELAETLTGKRLGNVKDPMKLQELIDAARADQGTEESPTSVAMNANAKREQMRKEQLKLVRVYISALSPFDKQIKGNFFSAGNAVLNNVTRYIPFDTEWHIEQILYQSIKEKMYRHRVVRKDPMTQRETYTNKFLPAYNIVLLDSLTPEELKAHSRAMRAREYESGMGE